MYFIAVNIFLHILMQINVLSYIMYRLAALESMEPSDGVYTGVPDGVYTSVPDGIRSVDDYSDTQDYNDRDELEELIDTLEQENE